MRAKPKRKLVSWNHYQQEIIVLSLFVLALFIAVSLISFNPCDNSWVYFSTRNGAITNKCGALGAHVAALCFYLFGSASFFIVVALWFMVYARYCKTFSQEWDRIGAAFLLLFVWSTICSFHAIDFWSSPYQGGVIGSSLCAFMQSYFDTLGSILLLYLLFVIALILVLRFSFISGVHFCVTRLEAFLRSRGAYQRINNFGIVLVDGFKRTCCVLKNCAVVAKKRILGSLLTITTSHKEEPSLQEICEFFENESPSNVPIIDVRDSDAAFTPSIVSATSEASYALPATHLFKATIDEKQDKKHKEEQDERASLLEEKLARFGIQGSVVAVKRGPVVTLFEYQPDADAKISKITALEDDLALALRALSIRIIAPIPGRSVVGFELANTQRKSVIIGSIIQSNLLQQSGAELPLILGEDTSGNATIIDLSAMPHLLVAGSTGSGKSVALNTMLISLLCKKTPAELKLILIDPKRLEFASYADIPHLLFPIITDPRRATPVLKWLVHEMEQRYEKMAQQASRTILDYNRSVSEQDRLPYIVMIIDELADLMMTASKEIEDYITRIAQMARAAGIHVIVATQRPSVDVLTGLIKVNFPSRISFRVTSKIDSRTILDHAGAEKLLGRGDMLFMSSSDGSLKRIHGAYVSDEEINKVVEHVRCQQQVIYLNINEVLPVTMDTEEKDPLFEEALNFVRTVDEVSISLLQRRFRIGYNRSARIIEMLEIQGFIMPSQGGKTRKVIKKI